MRMAIAAPISIKRIVGLLPLMLLLEASRGSSGSSSPDLFIGTEGVDCAIGEPLQVQAGETLQMRLAHIACWFFNLRNRFLCLLLLVDG